MSKKPGLAALKAQIASERPRASSPAPAPASDPAPPELSVEAKGGRRYPTYREGKVPVGGYFSPELSRALHQLALDESEPGKPRVKIQALLGEAVDLLLRSRNRSPLGER
jgi:hypothetical protein